METKLPWQQDLWLMPIVSGNLGTNNKLNMTSNKEIIILVAMETELP